jgi:hypothetical protein
VLVSTGNGWQITFWMGLERHTLTDCPQSGWDGYARRRSMIRLMAAWIIATLVSGSRT